MMSYITLKKLFIWEDFEQKPMKNASKFIQQKKLLYTDDSNWFLLSAYEDQVSPYLLVPDCGGCSVGFL